MRIAKKTSITILTAAALGVTVLTGCESGSKQHDEWVDQANGRWLTLRSTMMLDMAQQQFDTGDLELADKTLREAMGLDPTNGRLHVLAGRIRLEHGQLERSYRMLNTAVELDENLPSAYYYQGVVLQRWQRYDAAYDRYSKAFELAADNPSYLLAMSEMLVELDRAAEGIALLESKLTYFDQNAGLRTAVGHLYMIQGRPDKAAVYFRKAALLDPDNLKVQEELALAQIATGKAEEAVATLRELVKHPDVAERKDLHRALAEAYRELGLRDDARAIYLKLARMEPADSGDWIKLAELAWKANDLGGTLHAANRVMNIAPQRHEGYLLAGMVWQKRNNLDNALTMFDRAAELAPDNAVPLIMRGIALQKAGRRTAAAEAYQEALQRKPGDTRAQRLLESVANATP